MSVLPFLVIILILATSIILSLAYTAYRITFHRPSSKYDSDTFIKQNKQTIPLMDKMLIKIETLQAIPYERVSVVSYDGTRLEARYIRGKEGAPLQLCIHGYRGTPNRDFASLATHYISQGYNVLLVEARGRLGSRGRSITFGVKERRDVLAWLRYCQEKHPDLPIVLNGISMGASTILMAAALGLPESVKGIVADCAYTTPTAILKKYTKGMLIPTFIAYPSVWIGAHVYGHFSYGGASAVTGAAASPVPILLIHGEDDHFVPCEMGKQIAAAAPKADLHLFPGAGHGLSYYCDPIRYEALVDGFMKQVLPPEA